MREFETRAPAAESESQDAQFTQRIIRMIWRGKWWLLVMPLASTVIGLAYVKFAPKVYMATARVEVNQKQITPMSDRGISTTKQRNYLKAQAEIFRSEPVIQRVLDDSESRGMQVLYSDPEEGPGAQLRAHSAAVGDVNTDMVGLSFQAEDPKEAEWCLNRMVVAFLDYHKERQKGSASSTYKIVDEQRTTLEAELLQKTGDLLDLKAENPALSSVAKDGGNLETDALDDINRSLTSAQINSAKSGSKYETLERQLRDRDAKIRFGMKKRLESTVQQFETEVQAYQSDRLAQETRKAKLMASLTADHPEIEKIQSNIDALQRSEEDIAIKYADAYLNAARVEALENAGELDSLQNALEAQEKRVKALAPVARSMELLQIEIDAIEVHLEEVRRRVKEIAMAEDVGGLNVLVIDNARANYEEPVSPRLGKTLQLAIPLGLLIGFGLALLSGFVDSRFWHADEVPGRIGLPVLAVLPRLTKDDGPARVGRLVDVEPSSRQAEAIRGVRTAISFSLAEMDSQTVLVASAADDEGRSTCASNLATAFARTGRSTLLLDADLRSPAQSKIFGLKSEFGLADVLAEGVDIDRAIAHDVLPNLDVLPSGNDSAGPAELVESPRLRKLIDELGTRYDCVVIDAPPVLESAEARILGALSAATLFVVRIDRTEMLSAKRASESLRSIGVRLLGAIVVGQPSKKNEPTYVGGFGYEEVSSSDAGDGAKDEELAAAAADSDAAGHGE